METTISSADAPASRETDVRVARVMGYLQIALTNGDYVGREPNSYRASWLPQFTSDDSNGYAAMRESLAWLRKKGDVTMRQYLDLWNVRVAEVKNGWSFANVSAPSLPLAVARVVLMVGESL